MGCTVPADKSQLAGKLTEFCLHTGISEEELNEIVGLGVV
ncbi:hypothetical protein ACUN90_30505, partial [Escherichia sp. SP-MK2]